MALSSRQPLAERTQEQVAPATQNKKRKSSQVDPAKLRKKVKRLHPGPAPALSFADSPDFYSRVLSECFSISEPRVFQIDSLRLVHQNQDHFILVPTGGGKSVCLWAGIFVDPKRPFALVNVPLSAIANNHADDIIKAKSVRVIILPRLPPGHSDCLETRLHIEESAQRTVLLAPPEAVTLWFSALKAAAKKFAVISLDEAHLAAPFKWIFFRHGYEGLVRTPWSRSQSAVRSPSGTARRAIGRRARERAQGARQSASSG